MLFMTLLWSLLLVPIGFLLLGIKLSNRIGSRETLDHDRIARVTVARSFGLISVIAPPILMAMSSLPNQWLGNVSTFLHIFVPAAGLLASIAAGVLFSVNARGVERVLGPLASLWADAVSIFLLWAGLHSG